MRNLLPKFRSYSAKRPFTMAVVVVLMIVIPGFVRFEQITDKLEASEDRELLEKDAEGLLVCQTRNTFQQNTRAKFTSFIDAVEVAFVSQSDSPQRADAIRIFTGQLRASVSTSPEDEDRDCNEDGIFDHKDYLP